VADRVVLQMAEAAFENQEILGRYRKRSQDSNPRCHHRLLPRGNSST